MRRIWPLFFALALFTNPRLMGAEPSAQAMVETLRDDDEATAAAAQEMLFKMGPDAVRPLQKALGDSNFKVRRRAAEVLGRLGPAAKRAAPELVELLMDAQVPVHQAAESALIQMGDDAIPALSSALKRGPEGARKDVLLTLSRCGPKAIPIILDLLKKDDNISVRVSAANILGGVKPTTPEIVEALIQALSDLDESLRGAAADSLRQIDGSAKAAIGPLLPIAERDKDSFVRKRASDALASIGPATNDSVAGLISGLHDPSEVVRRQIIDVIRISSISFSNALPPLESALKDPDILVKIKAIETSVYLGGDGAMPVLKAGLADSNRDVRAAAIQGLGQMKTTAPEAASELAKLHSDPNPVIQQDAIRALGQLGVAGIGGLLQAMDDGTSVLSDQAAGLIIQMGPEAVPALQIWAQGPDPLMKKKAEDLLRRIQHKPHKSKK